MPRKLNKKQYYKTKKQKNHWNKPRQTERETKNKSTEIPYHKKKLNIANYIKKQENYVKKQENFVKKQEKHEKTQINQK